MKGLLRRLSGGKNPKLLYYVEEYGRRLVPRFVCLWRRKRMLRSLERRTDYPLLKKRLDYYCGIADTTTFPKISLPLGRYPRHNCFKVYRLDSGDVLRYFPQRLRWRIEGGDNVSVFPIPTVVKSRPLCPGNRNDVLLKLNRVRHYIFVDDRLRWEDKKDLAVFRGKCSGKPLRIRFLNRFAGSELVDAGCNDCPEGVPERCFVKKMSLYEQLSYKFVVCLEGNDVASNLKWVMGSNSLAVMPHPRFETWFMEGLLEPGVHYVEVHDDFSDLEDKLRYYIAHPEEAERIVRAANAWTEQFRDGRTERHLQIAVMQRYFERTGQLPRHVRREKQQ